MNCTTCKNGLLKPGITTVTLNKDGCVVVFKNVPALVCDTCGDFVTDEVTSTELLETAAAEAKRGAEVSVLNYRLQHAA